MKRVNTFLILQYITLAGTIAVPLIVASFISQDIKKFIPGLACIFLVLLVAVIIAATVITEIACVKRADSKPQALVKIWKKLKFLTIPFYVINFIVYVITAPITFPVSLFIFPLDGLLCLIMIIISGTAGIKAIKMLKQKGKKISGIHYVFQLLPVFDVLSTLSLEKYTK